jgi:hypothetical protein
VLVIAGADAHTGKSTPNFRNLWRLEWNGLSEELLKAIPKDGREVFTKGSRKKVLRRKCMSRLSLSTR